MMKTNAFYEDQIARLTKVIITTALLTFLLGLVLGASL